MTRLTEKVYREKLIKSRHPDKHIKPQTGFPLCIPKTLHTTKDVFPFCRGFYKLLNILKLKWK